jgi:hypothetical protein
VPRRRGAAARLADDPQLQDAPAVWEPQDNRVGLANFEMPGLGRKILRVVHLRSYSFFLAFVQKADRSGHMIRGPVQIPRADLLNFSSGWKALVSSDAGSGRLKDPPRGSTKKTDRCRLASNIS